MSAHMSTVDGAVADRRQTSPHGPEHFQITEPAGRTIRVKLDGVVIAESDDALILKEVGHSVLDPVYYLPRDDVRMERFELVEGKHTKCPIKGEASYWSYRFEGEDVDSLAWSYEEPLEYSEAIRGYLAFDPRHVTIEVGPKRS